MNYNEIYGGSVEADMLVYMGGELKKLSAGPGFGGYGVLHTTAKDVDLTGEFFSIKSDLDLEDGDRRSIYFNHGFDPLVKHNRIGTAIVKRDDVGLWVEAQLDARSEYASAVMDLISKQALGFSSGAVGHLVRRESVGKSKSVAHITHWPVGEISITPCPAEPRTLAVPLKTWAQSLFNPQTQETPAAETEVKAAVSISTVRQFEEFLREAGFAKDAALTIASKGFSALHRRDAEELDDTSDTFRADSMRELARIEMQYLREAGVAL